MNTYKKTSLRRVLAIIACAVLCCFTTLAFTFFGGDGDNNGYTVPPISESNSVDTSTPYRNYTEIRAGLFASDVVFYNKVSTGYGIKQNLRVVGVYNGKEYILSPDEFYVTADGLGEIDKLNFATNPKTLTVTVCVPGGSKTLTAKTDITIEDELPVFTVVTATGSSEVSNDNTATSIKNELTVKGTVDGKQITVNRELYTVSLSTLNVGSPATATLTFDGGVYGSTVSVTFASVRAAAITSISIGTSSAVKLENGFYKKGAYSAFVDGMPFFDASKPSVFLSLDVYVFYENTSEKANFVVSDNTVNVTLGNPAYKNITASASGSTAAGTNNITLTLRLATGATLVDSITLPFESLAVSDIDVAYNKPSTTVYSYTPIDDISSYITVKPIYNDGSIGGAIDVGVKITGTLTPTSATLNSHKNDTDWSYEKEITVSYETSQGRTISRSLKITDIVYKEPDTLGSIAYLSIPQQTMTYDFDYTGFFISAEYNDGFDNANYYLSDISYDSTMPIYKTIAYYDKSNNQITSTDNTVPKDAAAARIAVFFGARKIQSSILRFTPVQAPVDYPTASEFVKDYSENCVIKLSGVKEYMKVSTADDATASHVEIGENNNGNVEIKFKSGGEFSVNVVIKDGVDGVYRFNDVVGESNITKPDSYTVTYRFVINKGEFDLSLEYGSGQDEWVYGGAPTAPTIKGTLGGKPYIIKNQDGQDGLAAGEIGVPYLLYYYGFNNRTYDNIVGKSYAEIAALCAELPEDVGEYYVVVITKETDAYAQSAAFRWNAHAVKITQKPLTLSVVNNAIYTRGTEYYANDVINTSSFEYGHKVADVMTVTANNAPFSHAGSYDITITLINNNYKWDSSVTTVAGDKTKTESKFTISKRDLDFTVSVTGFTYGDTSVNLNPIFTYQDGASSAFTPAKNNFYAVVGTPVYYHATSAGAKTGTAINLTTNPMNKWAAGKYYVEYTTSVDTASGDLASDYNTPTAGAAFDVSRKSLSIPTFNGVSGTYDGNTHDITIVGFAGIVSALVNGEGFDDVFAVTTEAKRTDNDNNYIASGADVSSTVSRTNGVITVTEAGSYKVTIAFKSTAPNYEWSDGTVNNVESDRYTLNKKELVITDAEDGGNAWVYKYDGAAHTPDPKLVGLSGHTVAIVTKIYTDSACTSIIAAANVTDVGDYWIRVEDYSVTAGGVSVNKANYKLPATTVFTFHIVAAGLNAPVLKDPSLGTAEVSAVYSGSAFNIGDYIDRWSTDFQVGGKDKVNVTVYANGVTATLKNVLYIGGVVSAYKVYIYPKDNYDWVDGVTTTALPSDSTVKAYVIDFTVTQLEVQLSWASATLQTAYNGSAQSPTMNISNKNSGDDVSAVIGFTQSSAEATAVNAGSYTAYVKSLDGAQKGNYKVSTTNADYSATYVITKKVIAKPVLPTGEDNAFNGTSGSKTVTAVGYTWGEYDGVVSVSVSGVVPSGWFVPSSSATVENITGATFTVGTGTFAYARAGEYTFTVSLDAYQNYCFAAADEKDFTRNSAYTYTAEDTFTVNRKKLAAPNISAKRAQEWDKGVTAIDFGTAVESVLYNVAYGTESDTVPTSNTWLGFNSEGTAGERGVYYAELTLSVTNALNYEWVENTVDTGTSNNGLGYVPRYALYYYNSNAVAIRLYYAITSSQINVDVKVTGYVFGDNGYVGDENGVVRGSAAFNAAGALDDDSQKTVYISGSGVADLKNSGISASLTDVRFVIFGTETDIDESELVNGLPWNAGKYTLYAKLAFGDGNTYQGKDVRVDFEVAKRAIDKITWTDTTAEYDFESHMAAATIKTVVKKSQSDTVVYTAGLTLVVGLPNGESDPVNADEYTVAVNNITVADGVVNNFKLPDTALTTTLNITAKAVTVSGTEVANHVYRDLITADEKKSNASTVFYNDGAAGFIEVKITDNDGNEIDRTAAVGDTYKVVVSWKANAGVHATNYEVTFVAAKFTIVKRTLTVTLNAANATSEYGDTVNLYSAIKPIYTVTACNGRDGVTDALADLTASDVFVFTCSASDSAAVNDYAITASAKDSDNFTITFSGEWKYTVTNATINDNGTIKGIANTAYKAANINVLADGFAVQTKKNTAAKWEYAFVDSADVAASAVTDWTVFTASPTVYNAGDYYLYVRVTANNHNPLIKQISVHVDKRELDVYVSFAIMYGENNPVTEKYKMTLKDLRTPVVNGGIYSVIGFCGSDNSLFYYGDEFYNLSGTAEYTVSGFTGEVGTYGLMFTGALTCDNYTFTAAGGTLTVGKIALTVDIKNQSVVYHTAPSAQPDLTVENTAYTVTLPKSTYNNANYIVLPDGNVYNDIFTLSSAAVTDKYDLGGGNKANTAGVGEYAIVGTNNIPEHYDITFVGGWNKVDANRNKAGKYTVTPAALDMSDIKGFEISYDEQYHGLVVTKSGSTTDVIATAVDGSAITVVYYESNKNIVAFSDDELAKLGNGSAVMPKYIDVGTYYVVYKVTAVNHTAKAACLRLRINHAQNAFVTDFCFANGKQFAEDIAGITDADAAWVYGLFGASSTDGYNKNGGQAVTEPQAQFTRLVDGSVNTLTFTLLYSAELSGDYSTVLTASSAALVFENGFKTGAFKAGYYKLHIDMPAGDSNYDSLSVSWVFKVAKRNLTVTVDDVTVMFGDNVTDSMYVGKYNGLVINSTAANATVDSIMDAIGDTLSISTDYVVGNEVDTYTITVSGGQSDNYNVTYNTAALTVTPREVTITIDNQENTYNLQNGETAKTLTFKIVGSTQFYNVEVPSLGVYNNSNQSVVTLYTDALTNADSHVKTNDVIYDDGVIGGYTIYAVYANAFAKKNYVIKFASCAMSETRDGAILGEGGNNAGKFTIKQATFSIEGLGVFHKVGDDEVKSNYYSGAQNYYKAQFTDNPNIEISFTYSIEGNSSNRFGSENVVNVGNYTAHAFTENHNYTAGAMSFPFRIEQTTVTLTADNTTIEYGTPLPTTYTADCFGGFSYTAHSKMNENGQLAEKLTPETLNKYLQDNPVSFTSPNYTAKIAAGTTWTTIIPVCSDSANIHINAVAATLEVVQRNVTVTVVGYDIANDGDDTAHNSAAWCYYQGVQADTQSRLDEQFANNIGKFVKVDSAATFGSSGDGLKQLGVKLSLPNDAVNVNASGYGMTVYSDSDNYNINFVTSKTADGVRQNRIEYNAADAPVFMIKKAPLTLYANAKNGNNIAAYSVVYGSVITLEYANGGTLGYAVDGMKNGELFSEILINNGGKLTYTVMCGNKAYAAWDSTTQETYTVTIAVSPISAGNTVEFENYEITSYVTATLNITKLLIDASTVNQVFDKAADGYHDGVYGKSHEAVITFHGVGSSASYAQNINVDYRPSGFTLTYNTKSIGNYQVAGKAPTVVGDYTVTVALAANGNYMFAGGALSVKLPFSVTKRVISDADLVWSRTQIATETETAFENKIVNYIDDIMTINTFMFQTQFGGGRTVEKNSANTEYYEIAPDGSLIIYFGSEHGTYEINFSLKNTATNNYVFESKNGTAVISAFTVSGDEVIMTVKVSDFTYHDTPSDPVVTINGSVVTIGLVFTYGKVTDTSNIANFVGKGDDFGGFDYAELAGLKFDTLKALSAFDAGYYVLYAYHPESSQSKYYVFRVNQKSVEAPIVSGAQPNVYNGKSQQLAFEYDLSIVRAQYAGTSVQNANGSAFFATDADNYEIGFRLVDSANYKWADSVTGVNNGVWTYNWTIAKDDAETDENDPYISMPTVSTLVFGQTFSRSTATVRAGYEGNIVYYYVSKSVSPDPAANGVAWVRAIPSDAGEYWIKAVVSDGNDNFTDKATVASLVINAKQITATAFYTITYGDTWKSNNFRYTVDGLLYGDKATASDQLRASLVDSYGILQAGGEYYITLNHDNEGVVLGLDAGKNYVIKAVQGQLTVNKRDVTVTIDSLSGYYTVTPDVSNVNYTVSNLAPNDDKSVLGIVFATDATSDSAANGLYWITAQSYDNSNYNVTNFNRGVYTVMRLAISVELTEQTGLIYGDRGIVGATMGAITCDIAAADIDKVRADLKLSFTYAGYTFGGVQYAGTTAPTAAGNYTATLVGVNDNYTLVGSAYVEFTIAKKTVDVSVLSVASQSYSGKPLTPVVTDGVYGTDIYTVSTQTFTDAGSNDVRLTLVDPDNYRWSDADGADYSLVFVINKIADAIDGVLSIKGWQYGCYDETVNSPSAKVKSGENITYQYSVDGENFTVVVPENGNAGTYYVRVYVAESKNYNEFVSAPVKFEIARFVISSPSLTVITTGKDKNDVFTGSDLSSAIVGFNPQLMQIAYGGRIQVVGNNVTVFAHDADVYTVAISLFNSRNYCWGDGDVDDDGTIELKWTVARKKIAKPTHDSSTKIVNGENIVYLPIGFDSSVMNIENNVYSYGGSFSAKISLKDTKNYEWATGDDKPFTIKWTIVGADSVFTAIISVLSVVAAACCVLILVQILLNRRRKRLTANTMRDIENGEATDNGNEGGAE